MHTMRGLMKQILQRAISMAMVCGTVWADDGLDAPLAKLKENAQRKNYSSRAILDHQNLNLPKLQDAEESALDLQLRQIDKSSNQSGALLTGTVAMPRVIARRRQPRPKPAGDKNWLATAVLKNLDQSGQKNESQQPFENPFDSTGASAESEQRASAQSAFPNAFSGREAAHRAPEEKALLSPFSAPTPKTSTSPFSLSSRRQQAQEAAEGASKQFHPRGSIWENQSQSTGHAAPSNIKPSFASPRKSAKMPQAIRPTWTEKTPQPLSPIQRIQRAAPVHREDPFSENLLGKPKRSIWD